MVIPFHRSAEHRDERREAIWRSINARVRWLMHYAPAAFDWLAEGIQDLLRRIGG